MLPQVWPAILTLGWILFAITAGEVVMVFVALASGDGMEGVFAAAAAVTSLFAGACVLTTKGRGFQLRFRDAVLLTVVSWFVVPAFAALPLLAKPIDLGWVDAYFEAVSGITTTGATVLAGLDTMAPSILLWRSTLQWIGGIGIVGLAIVILPFLKIGGMQLFRLESSDRSEGVFAGVRGLADSVARIYLTLTLACFFAYWALGMTPFDALNHAFTTVCTGGFSTHDASFTWFDSRALDWVAVLFMAAGALPFISYVRFVRRGSIAQRVDPQVVAFFAIAAALSTLLSLWLVSRHLMPAFQAVTSATFSVISVMTTTGFGSGNFASWGAFAAVFIFLVSFLGGCTGSTSGGLKVFRLQIMGSVVGQHVRQAVHPHVVSPILYGGRQVTDDEVASVGTFFFFYLGAFVVIAAACSFLGMDAASALSATAASIGNVGPGITEALGPAGNFGALSDPVKLLLTLAMIVGRLEVGVVLLLLLPSFYR